VEIKRPRRLASVGIFQKGASVLSDRVTANVLSVHDVLTAVIFQNEIGPAGRPRIDLRRHQLTLAWSENVGVRPGYDLVP